MPKKIPPLNYVLSNRAKDDLKTIGRYTQGKWGRIQRVKYLGALKARCAFLADNKELGKYYEELGYYYWHEGRHYIFYRIDHNQIVIVRFLHDSMDFPQHLKEVADWQF